MNADRITKESGSKAARQMRLFAKAAGKRREYAQEV